MDQESDLEHWARSNNCWHTHPQEYYKSLGYQFYGFGGEAQVYADGDTYVHKVCRTGQYDTCSVSLTESLFKTPFAQPPH